MTFSSLGRLSPQPGGGDDCRRTERLVAIARRLCTVLIHGETGAGKEVTARRIHQLSPRRQGPFVAVDCTGLRDELMESQLFGHERGAFTGAERSTIGFFRTAEKGTLFLDEIGELSLPLQAKLLRSIQERSVIPLGGVKPVPVDVRIVCATHRDLWKMAKEGRFRSDLLYRLDVVRLDVAPLRMRLDEIPDLVRVFLDQFAAEYDDAEFEMSGEAMSILLAHPWPGNVRELRNAVEHAYVFATDGVILPEHLPRTLFAAGENGSKAPRAPVPTLAEAERSLIASALEHANGNHRKAAKWLDMDPRRLGRKIEAHGLMEASAASCAV